MDIEGSVVMITGGAMRVGRTMALTLAQQGANIAFTYLHDGEPWQETLADIETIGVKAAAFPLDVRHQAEPKTIVDRICDRWGRVDVLVNSASIWLSAPFLDITASDWQAAMDVNLTGPFLCAQAVAPIMLAQQSGVIINITDLSAFQAWPTYAHHAASKAGLVAMTKVMAVELAPYVRVNAVAPGTVLLPPNATPEKRAWAEENSLLKRIGSPEDVARTVAFLIEMDFVTGAVYFVDGGRALV